MFVDGVNCRANSVLLLFRLAFEDFRPNREPSINRFRQRPAVSLSREASKIFKCVLIEQIVCVSQQRPGNVDGEDHISL